MRHTLLLALLALSACSSSAPSTYSQMAPGAPPMRASPPAWDSPAVRDTPTTTGQPGYVGPIENLPRSPYTRTLPQTPQTRKEPGIWATSAPKDGPTIKLDDDVVFPLPENSSPDVLKYAKRCEQATYKAFSSTPELYNWIALAAGDDHRPCVLFHAWRYCMRSPIWPQAEQDAAKKAVEHAFAFMDVMRRCSKWEEAVKDPFDRDLRPALRAWYNNNYLPRLK